MKLLTWHEFMYDWPIESLVHRCTGVPNKMAHECMSANIYLLIYLSILPAEKKRQNERTNQAENFSVRDFLTPPLPRSKKYHLSRLEPTFVFEKQYKLYFHCRAISRGSYRFLAQLRRAKLLQSVTAGGTTRPRASADGLPVRLHYGELISFESFIQT